jgi:serine/threonine-protein kinase
MALVQKAVPDRQNEQWARPFFEFARGLAAYRQGHFDEAISLMRGEASRVLGPGPGLVQAMSLQQNGQLQDALNTLTAAVLEYDWRTNRFNDPGAWTLHLLRREAERNILPHLTEFLEGTYQPQDNAERLALLGICQYQARWGTAARLFADAFAADPTLADRISAERLRRMPIQEGTMDPAEVYRSSSVYGAARCAVLASGGLGSDAAQITEAERLAMRKQASQWLQTDLKMWQRLLASDAPAERDMARNMLSHWQSEPDLALVRDPGALDKLAAEEAAECRELWNSVQAALSAQPAN